MSFLLPSCEEIPPEAPPASDTTFVERSRKKQSLSRREAREISFKFLFYTLVSCKKYTFLEKIECKGNWKEKVMKNYKHTQNIYINSYIIIYDINSA